MKKTLIFYAIILTVFVSCTKESNQEIDSESVHSFRINTTAPVLETDDAGTKASMQAVVKLQWSNGDQISVVNLSTGKTMLGNLTAKVNGDKVSFEGELSGSLKSGDKMAAIYPCQNYSGIIAIPDFEIDLSAQTCTSKDDLQFVAYSLFDCKTAGVVEVTSDFIVPVSFNQISLATIDPETKIDYVELSNVGNKISFHANTSEMSLELTPSVGKVRITPESKLSGKNGALFAYCALASSPASKRTVIVQALPKIYVAPWAESAMSSSKFYTSTASNFDSQVYKDFMVSAPSSLDVDYLGGSLVFTVTSNNISWTASSTPTLNIEPASGNGCENLEVTVTVPQNDESTNRSFLVTFSGGSDEYNYKITQKADPNLEIVEFADINLKKYMVSLYDEDEDGEISVAEAEDVVNINCSNKNISDLSGLEKCPNLKYLDINGNSVCEIVLPNLSKLETIVAYGNPIEKININNDTSIKALYLQDVSTNAIYSETQIRIRNYEQASTLYLAFAGTKYTTLVLSNSTALTSFDVSENTQLTSLWVNGNTLVKSIDVSSLTALTLLYAYDCALESLDVTNNVNLTTLSCYGNKLTSLDIDNNAKLKVLNVSKNNLTSIRLSNNTALEEVNVANNDLLNINVRKCTLLKNLYVENNTNMTVITLDNNPNLEKLNVSNTGITDIDLSANQNLTLLKINSCNGIHSIDLTKNTALTQLDIGYTPITTLDLTKNTALTDLNASYTAITALDLSNNTALINLNASSTSITVLDLSRHTKLVKVNVSKLLLKDLDLSNSTNLSSLDITQCTALSYLAYNGCAIHYTSIQLYCIINISGDYQVVYQSSGSKVMVLHSKETIASIPGILNWPSTLGEGWRVPSILELKDLRDKMTELNNVLTSISGATFGNHYNYWSNERVDADHYRYLEFATGYTEVGSRTTNCHIRAVRQF